MHLLFGQKLFAIGVLVLIHKKKRKYYYHNIVIIEHFLSFLSFQNQSTFLGIS